MLLLDVNVLVYAYMETVPEHAMYRDWLDELVNSSEAFGLSDLALSGVLRIVTHPRIFTPPAPMADALDFVDAIREQPNCVVLAPGPRHWQIFAHLCAAGGARGNLVPDAYFAALAIESGSEWITADGDYGRFPGLRWRRPF